MGENSSIKKLDLKIGKEEIEKLLHCDWDLTNKLDVYYVELIERMKFLIF